MPPIRRYLRITRHSVLEVRIYLTDPYSQSWLLNPRLDVLPRIIAEIKPFVFQQLRDDSARAGGAKSKKKKGVKDTAYGEDFEVSVFLTDSSTRHAIMVKQKGFREKRKKMRSNSGKLTSWLTAGTNERPIEVDVDDNDERPVEIREESGDEERGAGLDKYPEAGAEADDEQPHRKSKRRRGEDADDPLFVQADEDVSEDEGFQAATQAGGTGNEAEDDDKKKMKMDLSYDGFSIYGRTLCLVVKKRKGAKDKASSANAEEAAGNEVGARHMLENWVSTQAAQEQIIDED
ncbi:MAG: hypothetical protein M1831_001991 [Alyxoria varia]|nr:MAG: hypothetical protein M1831_001991 [Alyxoria varia]